MRRRTAPSRRAVARAAAARAGALELPLGAPESGVQLELKERVDALPDADRNTVFALDIGTRSIVGVLGREERGRFRVLDMEKEEHGRRAMLDGQIEDIGQVAAIARAVIDRIEARQHIRLRRVCVAAAGRALKSQRGSFTLEFSEPTRAGAEIVNQLEAGAVSAAENELSGGETGVFYMVGYTASQYRLDGYPMSTLEGHRGRVLEADVVATFLPREVVDSLYTVVSRLGLEVSSLTLEPIASLNAAIPVDIRLLNLVLVDIGAGTSDIAVCRDGSVTGYTMATVAGDEVTELLMKRLLIDFQAGEALKMAVGGPDPLRYTDILGIVHECTSEEIIELIAPAVELLAGEIADKVIELNGAAPSAVFLAGGGSKLYGLREAVAKALGMDGARVAIAGNHFEKCAFSEEYALNDPEYSTPLGIAVSAALGMINDSYVVTLNGEPAKLFRSGTLTLRDILLMNGRSYGDMIGRTGANLSFTVNGERQFFRGEAGTPPVIRVNDEEAELTTVIHAGDSIAFTPAKAGANASCMLAELLGEDYPEPVLVNGRPAALDQYLQTGDIVETDKQAASARLAARGKAKKAPAAPAVRTETAPAKAEAGEKPAVKAVQAPAAPVKAAPVKPAAAKPAPAAPIRPASIPAAPAKPVTVQTAVPAEGPAPSPKAPLPPLAFSPLAAAPEPAKTQGVPPVRPPVPPRPELLIRLNGEPLRLPQKESGEPYYLMDVLQYSGLDFAHLERPVELAVNGAPGEFGQALAPHDEVTIRYREK